MVGRLTSGAAQLSLFLAMRNRAIARPSSYTVRKNVGSDAIGGAVGSRDRHQ